jgi:tetrahydromethanopterin S-methyltransferase subunit F
MDEEMNKETGSEEAVGEESYVTAPVSEIGLPSVADPQLMGLDTIVDRAKYKAQLIARTERWVSAEMATESIGFFIGFLAAMVFVLIPIIYWVV